jgi:non-structural maintenance of chromosomes element 4
LRRARTICRLADIEAFTIVRYTFWQHKRSANKRAARLYKQTRYDMARMNAEFRAAGAAHARLTESPSLSPGSASVADSDSDKENSRSRNSLGKRKGVHRSMATTESQDNAKRRRIMEQTQQSQRRRTLDTNFDTRYYDPDQNPEERRQTKRSLRDLHLKLNDSRQEYLQANSKGLLETVEEANKLFENVKQTTDALVDSRLLVSAAELAGKKVDKLSLGDSSLGVDVEDFVTKCIAFMKRPERGQDGLRRTANATQTQRRRAQRADSDDDDEDNGDAMNWEYLGRNACIMYNSRPPLSGFLLGPLSVEKKVRQQTQRRAREEVGAPTQHSRTLRLTEEELDNQEKQSLTAICSEILRILQEAQDQGAEAVERDFVDGMGQEDVNALMDMHNVTSDGSVPLFKFCINPKSFGQTVENLFYVSFLIKEGRAGLGYDSRGLPTIGVARERELAARQEAQRNQAVFTMSFEIWEDIVDSFGIRDCIIPHREDQDYDDGVLQDVPRRVHDEEDPDMYD